ncbi:hypothetical protein GYMLUDRAFT_55293 [Collybiopsis luxurians FD-317 M1]|nr:hypothetical protein GYMLUDRAFT_55293 [Collybiopsis luxurians FD-317 M1]
MLDLNAGTPLSGTYYLDSNAGSPMYSTAPPAPSPYGSTNVVLPGFSSQNSPPLPHDNHSHFGSTRADTAGMLQGHSNIPPIASSGYNANFDEFSPNTLYAQNQDSNAPGSVAGSSSTASRSGFDPSRLVSMKNAQSMKVRDEQLRNSEIRVHTDSGVRLPSSNEREIIDVPPLYTHN